MKRRTFLQSLAALPIVSALLGTSEVKPSLPLYANPEIPLVSEPWSMDGVERLTNPLAELQDVFQPRFCPIHSKEQMMVLPGVSITCNKFFKTEDVSYRCYKHDYQETVRFTKWFDNIDVEPKAEVIETIWTHQNLLANNFYNTPLNNG